jgi:hypothetical protein
MEKSEETLTNWAWNIIFEKFELRKHDFKSKPFIIDANEIKSITEKEGNKLEPRLVCYLDNSTKLPKILAKYNLFILPIENGKYALVQGQGYFPIEENKDEPVVEHTSKIPFDLLTLKDRKTESEHLDYFFHSGALSDFFGDNSLMLTFRGKKRTSEFKFKVGEVILNASGVQTEVDAGFEGEERIILVEAKSQHQNNFLIRQLYYPFRLWLSKTKNKKTIHSVFFYFRNGTYNILEYRFNKTEDYNSIEYVRSRKYKIT